MTEKYVLGSGTRFPAWLSSGPISPNNLASPVPSPIQNPGAWRRPTSLHCRRWGPMEVGGGGDGGLRSNGKARPVRQEAYQEQVDSVITQLVANSQHTETRQWLGPAWDSILNTIQSHSHSQCKYQQISQLVGSIGYTMGLLHLRI